MLRQLIIACMLLIAGAELTNAQVTPPAQPLQDTTIARVIALYNREGTTRLSGETRIAAASVIGGDVAILNGPVSMAGRITGDVAVINGDIELLPGAVIEGSLTVIGGDARVDERATVTKGTQSYRAPLRFREENGFISYVEASPEAELSAGYDFPFGRTDILVAVRGYYNRVEGLPIEIGPRATIGDDHPLRLRALMVYRTANGLTADPDRMGYHASAQQSIGGGDRYHIGGSLYREIEPIESWGLSERETSLATFLLHEDKRDHYERRGWSIGAWTRHAGLPYEIGLEFRDERHRSVTPASPLTLFDNDERWRAEPFVAEGDLQSITATFNYDTRNDVTDPADGWLLNTFIEQGIGGSLEFEEAAALPATVQRADRFSVARFDMRRYARLTPYSRLAIRVIAAGSIDGGPLPPQRQQTLGGEGSLPAYSLFAFDCGARDNEIARGDDTFYPYYGCDRLAVVQLEYQASFPMARKLGERLRLGSLLTNSVRWAAFFDAGRTWTEAESRNGRGRGRDDFSADAGLGVRLGPVGLYWAVPLSGSDHEYNFFVRLGRRL